MRRTSGCRSNAWAGPRTITPDAIPCTNCGNAHACPFPALAGSVMPGISSSAFNRRKPSGNAFSPTWWSACYANLRYGAPALVVPTQPEQVTNGLNLAAAGCGRVLVKSQQLLGHSIVYEKAFHPRRFEDTLTTMIHDGACRDSLMTMQRHLEACDTRGRFLSIVSQLV